LNLPDAPPHDERSPERTGPAATRQAPALSRGKMAGAVLGFLILLGLLVLAWESAARRGLVDPFFVSQPSIIAYQLFDWWHGATSRGPLAAHIGLTLGETAAGAAGGSLAAALALAACPADSMRGRILRLATGIAQPAVGIGIAAAVAMGLSGASGWVPKAVFAALAVFALAIADARRSRPAASRLRLRCQLALAAAVLAECLVPSGGVGFLIVRSLHQFNAGGVYAALVVLVAMSVAIDAVAAACSMIPPPRQTSPS
jgi:NitT/TauT family transport system permease protein